ncbi:MAG: helix-turn-helix domain containing protein [Candidatus Portnoybacteria bacterium]|nr:helix-turn-helix domain containing protein [Candidatus Portnoybacteria bacterium]
MGISTFRLKKIEELKQKAVTLYKQGLTTREVGKIMGKSHTWVWDSVREKLPDAMADQPKPKHKKAGK